MATSTADSRLLWARAAGRCSICRVELVSAGRALLGEMAHIVARRPAGARGDDPLPVDQRDAYENLMLLCPNHHTEVDSDAARWPVPLLQRTKREHEDWVTGALEAGTIDAYQVTPPDQFLEERVALWRARGSWYYLAVAPLTLVDELVDPLGLSDLMRDLRFDVTFAVDRFRTGGHPLGLVNERLEGGSPYSILITRSGFVEVALELRDRPAGEVDAAWGVRGVGGAETLLTALTGVIPYSWLESDLRRQLEVLFRIWRDGDLPVRDAEVYGELLGMEGGALVHEGGWPERYLLGRKVEPGERIRFRFVLQRDTDVEEALSLGLRRYVNCLGLELTLGPEGRPLGPRLVER